MDQNDQQAIGGLFNKLATVERQAPQRDAEAESFINSQIAQQPSAPYYMAQTIVVQEQALNAAQARIEELERLAAEEPQSGQASGGLFGGLFGGGSQPRRSGLSVPRVGGRAGGMGAGQSMGMGAAQQPSFPPQQQPQRGGGGFLAGAAQTAMGVAGGVLLGNAIAGMFGGNEAQAAEAPAEAPADDAADDATAQDASFDDGGGFDLGGFDEI